MDDHDLPEDPQQLFDMIGVARSEKDWRRAQSIGRAMLRAVARTYGAYHARTDQALAMTARAHFDGDDRFGGVFFVKAMKRPRELGGMNPVKIGPEEEAQVEARLAEAKELQSRSAGLWFSKDWARIEPLAARVLEIHEWAYGTQHPDVAQALEKLAQARRMLSGNQAALPLYERALRIFENTLGPDFPDATMVLLGLGQVLEELDQVPRAIKLIERYVAFIPGDQATAGWLEELRKRPVSAEAAHAMGREELFTLVAEEVFRDGVVEEHENEILNKLVRFLKMSTDRAKQICRAAKEKFDAGAMGPKRALDRDALYERILVAVGADGKIDDQERQMLGGMRALLAVDQSMHDRLWAKLAPTRPATETGT